MVAQLSGFSTHSQAQSELEAHLEQAAIALAPADYVEVPAAKLEINSQVLYEGRILKVRRLYGSQTRGGLHVHLLPLDFVGLDPARGANAADRYEAAFLVRVPCPATHPFHVLKQKSDRHEYLLLEDPNSKQKTVRAIATLESQGQTRTVDLVTNNTDFRFVFDQLQQQFGSQWLVRGFRNSEDDCPF